MVVEFMEGIEGVGMGYKPSNHPYWRFVYFLEPHNACRELYYLALCTHCRPMITELHRLCHHRPAIRAESQIIKLSACTAGL